MSQVKYNNLFNKSPVTFAWNYNMPNIIEVASNSALKTRDYLIVKFLINFGAINKFKVVVCKFKCKMNTLVMTVSHV